jgi:hypothetical protein
MASAPFLTVDYITTPACARIFGSNRSQGSIEKALAKASTFSMAPIVKDVRTAIVIK